MSRRDWFDQRLAREGGFRIQMRMLGAEEGGRRSPISGEAEYRVDWSIESTDPDQLHGGPTLIDDKELRPGDEGAASLIPMHPEAWSSVVPGTSLTAREGRRAVAVAVVTGVVAPAADD